MEIYRYPLLKCINAEIEFYVQNYNEGQGRRVLVFPRAANPLTLKCIKRMAAIYDLIYVHIHGHAIVANIHDLSLKIQCSISSKYLDDCKTIKNPEYARRKYKVPQLVPLNKASRCHLILRIQKAMHEIILPSEFSEQSESSDTEGKSYVEITVLPTSSGKEMAVVVSGLVDNTSGASCSVSTCEVSLDNDLSLMNLSLQGGFGQLPSTDCVVNYSDGTEDPYLPSCSQVPLTETETSYVTVEDTAVTTDTDFTMVSAAHTDNIYYGDFEVELNTELDQEINMGIEAPVGIQEICQLEQNPPEEMEPGDWEESENLEGPSGISNSINSSDVLVRSDSDGYFADNESYISGDDESSDIDSDDIADAPNIDGVEINAEHEDYCSLSDDLISEDDAPASDSNFKFVNNPGSNKVEEDRSFSNWISDAGDSTNPEDFLVQLEKYFGKKITLALVPIRFNIQERNSCYQLKHVLELHGIPDINAVEGIPDIEYFVRWFSNTSAVIITKSEEQAKHVLQMEKPYAAKPMNQASSLALLTAVSIVPKVPYTYKKAPQGSNA